MPADAILDDNTETSSTSTTTSKQGETQPSMDEFIKQGIKANEQTPSAEGTEDSPPSEEVAEDAELDSKIESNEKEKGDAAQEEKTPEGETEDEEEDSKESTTEEETEVPTVEDAEGKEKPVAYERFREVNDRVKEAEGWKAQNAGRVNNYNNIVAALQQAGVSDVAFNGLLEFLVTGNPEKAAPLIKQWHEQVQGLSGDRLDADLQTEVDAGELKLDRAKEMQKLRAQTKYGESQSRRTQQQLEQERQANLRQAYDTATSNWIRQKQSVNPNFKPKTELFDEVDDKYLAMLNRTDERGQLVNQVNNPQQMVALMEKAYLAVEAKRKANRTNGKPLTKKRLPSNGSSTNAANGSFESQPTLAGAITVGMKQRGYKPV